MAMPPPFPRALAGARLLIAALVSASCSSAASAQAVTPADLLALTSRVDGLGTDVGGLRTSLTGLGTEVASLKVQVGELRGLLVDLPDVVGPDGPVDLTGILARLNTQTLANTTKLADVNLNVTALQNTVVTQTARLDDHERRITRNTNDIRRHERAISELQSQMANGLADVRNELRDHDRRIHKASEGVAMALAMKSPAVPEDKNFALSGSLGAFDDKTALAFAGGVRATDALQFDAGIAVGLEGGSVGGRAGATLAW